MKLSVPAALAALIVAAFGGGALFLLNLDPTAPYLTAGDRAVLLAAKSPPTVLGAAWFVCQANGQGRFIFDARSPKGDIAKKVRMERTVSGPAVLSLGGARFDTTATASGAGLLEHYVAPVATDQVAAAYRRASDGAAPVILGLDTLGQKIVFDITAERAAIDALLRSCPGGRP